MTPTLNIAHRMRATASLIASSVKVPAAILSGCILIRTPVFDVENGVFDVENDVFDVENDVFDVENVVFDVENDVFDVENDVFDVVNVIMQVYVLIFNRKVYDQVARFAKFGAAP